MAPASRPGSHPEDAVYLKIYASRRNFWAPASASCGNEGLSLQAYVCRVADIQPGTREVDIGDMQARRALKVLVRTAMAAAGAALLAGCNEDIGVSSNARAFAPIPEATLASFTAKGTTRNAPVLIRAYKKEAELEVWKQGSDGRYVYVKTYPMCRWSGQLGPKQREGDRQVPEGFYTVTPGSMNPNSAYYLSFNVGYPNAYDRAWGRTGGSIMVHGICSSAGCFSMTDTQIEEIYAIMRESFAGGQHAVQMQSFPFRMTAENLAKHRLDPNIGFWRELKKGADEFEVTKMQTPVGVCNRHYVFAKPKGGASFDAEAACPPLDLDKEVLRAVADKEARDESEVQSLVAKGIKPIRIVYQDGGQNPAFAHRFAEVSRPDAIAAAPTEIVLDDTPKARSVAVQIASARRAVGDGLDRPETPVAGGGRRSRQAGGARRQARDDGLGCQAEPRQADRRDGCRPGRLRGRSLGLCQGRAQERHPLLLRPDHGQRRHAGRARRRAARRPGVGSGRQDRSAGLARPQARRPRHLGRGVGARRQLSPAQGLRPRSAHRGRDPCGAVAARRSSRRDGTPSL